MFSNKCLLFSFYDIRHMPESFLLAGETFGLPIVTSPAVRLRCSGVSTACLSQPYRGYKEKCNKKQISKSTCYHLIAGKF